MQGLRQHSLEIVMFQLPVLPKLGLAKCWKSCKFTSRTNLSRNLKEHFKNKNPITCVRISVLVQNKLLIPKGNSLLLLTLCWSSPQSRLCSVSTRCLLKPTEIEALLSLYTKHSPIPRKATMVQAYSWTLTAGCLSGTYIPRDRKQLGLLKLLRVQLSVSAAVPAVYQAAPIPLNLHLLMNTAMEINQRYRNSQSH